MPVLQSLSQPTTPQQGTVPDESTRKEQLPSANKEDLRRALSAQAVRTEDRPRPRSSSSTDPVKSEPSISTSESPYLFEYVNAVRGLDKPHPALSAPKTLEGILAAFKGSDFLASAQSAEEATKKLNGLLMEVDPSGARHAGEHPYRLKDLLGFDLLALPSNDRASLEVKAGRLVQVLPDLSIDDIQDTLTALNLFVREKPLSGTFDDKLEQLKRAEPALRSVHPQFIDSAARLAPQTTQEGDFSSLFDAAGALKDLHTELSRAGIPLDSVERALAVDRAINTEAMSHPGRFEGVKEILDKYESRTGFKLDEGYAALLPALIEVGLVRRGSVEQIIEDLVAGPRPTNDSLFFAHDLIGTLKSSEGKRFLESNARGAALAELLQNDLHACLQRIVGLGKGANESKSGANLGIEADIVFLARNSSQDGGDLLTGLQRIENILLQSPGIPLPKVLSVVEELSNEVSSLEDQVSLVKFLHARGCEAREYRILVTNTPSLRKVQPLSRQLDTIADLCDSLGEDGRYSLLSLERILVAFPPDTAHGGFSHIPEQVKEFEQAWGPGEATSVTSLHQDLFPASASSAGERLADLAWFKREFPGEEQQRVLSRYTQVFRALYTTRDLSNRELLHLVSEMSPTIKRLETGVNSQTLTRNVGEISVSEVLEAIDSLNARQGSPGIREVAANLARDIELFEQDVPTRIRLMWIKDGRSPDGFTAATKAFKAVHSGLHIDDIFNLANANISPEFYAARKDRTIVEVISEGVQDDIRNRVGAENFPAIKNLLEQKYGVKYFTADATAYIDTYQQDVLLRSHPQKEFPGGKVIFLTPEYRSDAAFLPDTSTIRDLKAMGFTVFVGGEPDQSRILETVGRVTAGNRENTLALIVSGHGEPAGLAVREGASPTSEAQLLSKPDSGALSVADPTFFEKVSGLLAQGRSMLVLNACGSGHGVESVAALAAQKLKEVSHVQAVSDKVTLAYGARRGADGLPQLLFDSSVVIAPDSSRLEVDQLLQETAR